MTRTLATGGFAAVLLLLPFVYAAVPQLLSAEYQIREVELGTPSGVHEVFTAAVFSLYFDQPLYLQHTYVPPSENGNARPPRLTTLSVHAAAAFMTLKPEYRQTLYGLTRLECATSGASFESYPVKTMDGNASMIVSPQLFPLPQARYSSPAMAWMNTLGEEEFVRANRTGDATNVLTYLLLLKYRRAIPPSVQEGDGDDVSAQPPARRVGKELRSNAKTRTGVPAAKWTEAMTADGMRIVEAEVFPEDQVPSCAIRVLSYDEQSWDPPVRLVNYALQDVNGSYSLTSASPARHAFHGYTPVTQEELTGNGNVFLQEAAAVQSRVQMGMGVILKPMVAKLTDISYPINEQMDEFVVPKLSKGMIEGLDGKGAPGQSVAKSRAVPFFFLETDSKLRHDRRQGEPVASDSVEFTGSSTRTRSPDELKEQLSDWREHVRTHPDEYLESQRLLQRVVRHVVHQQSGANGTAGNTSTGSEPRFAELQTTATTGGETKVELEPASPTWAWELDHMTPEPRLKAEVDKQIAAMRQAARDAGEDGMRFEQLDSQRVAMRDRVTHAAAVTSGKWSEGAASTEPGPFPQKLIKYLIKELTIQLTIGITAALGSAIADDVIDLQIDDMKEMVKDHIVKTVMAVVPVSVSKTVPVTVPGILNRYLPLTVGNSVTSTLTRVLTRGLTHAIAPSLAFGLSRPSAEEYACSLCYYYKQYCSTCSFTQVKKGTLLYNVDFLTDYYSDAFADQFTGRGAAPGW